MNNRKKMSSQESDIPVLIDSLGNWDQGTLSLTPKAPPNHERYSLILLFWVYVISQPLLSWFSEYPLLLGILRFLYTALITPNNTLKLLHCPVQSLCNMLRLQLGS